MRPLCTGLLKAAPGLAVDLEVDLPNFCPLPPKISSSMIGLQSSQQTARVLLTTLRFLSLLPSTPIYPHVACNVSSPQLSLKMNSNRSTPLSSPRSVLDHDTSTPSSDITSLEQFTATPPNSPLSSDLEAHQFALECLEPLSHAQTFKKLSTRDFLETLDGFNAPFPWFRASYPW